MKIQPKCPECGEQITYLLYRENVISQWEFDGDDYENMEFLSVTDQEYVCPVCRKFLTSLESEAIKILKGDEE